MEPPSPGSVALNEARQSLLLALATLRALTLSSSVLEIDADSDDGTDDEVENVPKEETIRHYSSRVWHCFLRRVWR